MLAEDFAITRPVQRSSHKISIQLANFDLAEVVYKDHKALCALCVFKTSDGGIATYV